MNRNIHSFLSYCANRPKYLLPVALIVVSFFALNSYSLDTITLKNGEIFTGVFDSFKNGRFYFTPSSGAQLNQLSAQVVSLIMDPMAEVSVKLRGQSKKNVTNFTCYKNGEFVFCQDGTESAIAKFQVTTIEIGMDFKRAMTHQQQLNQQAQQTNTDIEKAIKKGMINIVHFHAIGETFDAASRAASTRSANYIGGLQHRNKNKLNIITITLDNWTDPAAVKYGIISVPQFWFYKKSGKLSTKLIERFTSADIDKALYSAQK
ncbi:MAG: hypothetical protein JXN60_09780 [Lentisphaerae bacterium]|nr:hypothetical protein [Lentisphaerota bacterium]